MGLRWLVLLVAMAAAIDISQALFSAFKQQREKDFKRYMAGVQEKRTALKKRQMDNDEGYCPLWDCYPPYDYYYDYASGSSSSSSSKSKGSSEEGSGSSSSGDMDYLDEMMFMMEEFGEARKCMKEMLQNGELCDCSLDDLYWSGIYDEEEMEVPDDSTCWECLGKLPNMFDPAALHFSCDAGAKIDEAEKCFNASADKTCLAKAMGGFAMQPETVFGGIRLEVAGCPLHEVVMDCMGFNSGSYRDPYTDCLMESVEDTKRGTCVQDLLQKLPVCKGIPDYVFPQIAESCKQGADMMCSPFKGAIKMKQACCPASQAGGAPAARHLSKLMKMLEKKGY